MPTQRVSSSPQPGSLGEGRYRHPRRAMRLARGVLGAWMAGALLATVAATAALADDVSTTPPSVYGEHLAPRLTPAEDALERARSVAESVRDGHNATAVLSETLTWVADDGATVWVTHEVERANTEKAVDWLARSTVGFRRDEQTVHLVLARTLRPDGSSVPVRPESTFVQTPQEEADDDLYSDRAELVMVFPQVEVGAAIEYVVVVETKTPRIPGEFTERLAFQYFWPSDQIRHVIELPAPMAGRLHTTPVGADVPRPVVEDLPSGRALYTWDRRAIPSRVREREETPTHDTGPVVWLTTLQSWADLADWYRGLLAGRDSLSPELVAEVEGWIEGLEDPQAIARVLTSKVADDIRYTGLEFGIAGFRPKSATEVWHDGFGDCKDKANLLRAFLAAAGIESHLVLLDTEHAGKIETRSPDYRHFNHAILAIEFASDGRYVYVDPTIPYLPPGTLGSRDMDRDVLVITDSGFRFARTPGGRAGVERLKLDLRPLADSVEGWVEMDIDGARSSAYRRYFDIEELWQLRERAEGILGSYLGDLDLVDVTTEEPEPGEAAAHFGLDAYFLQPEADQAADGSRRLPLPHFFDQDDIDAFVDETRHSDLFQRRLRQEVEARFELPAGWVNLSPVPAPFSVATPAFAADGAWTCADGVCRARFAYEYLQAVVPAAEVAELGRALRAFVTWIEDAPRVGPGEEAGALASQAPAAGDAELRGFPVLSSGAAQLRLAERKFPADSDPVRYRAALAKVEQWFPDDTEAVLEARVRRAILDCGRGGDAPTAIRAAIDAAGDAKLETRAWARYMLAGCAETPVEEQRALLTELLDDEELTNFRRAWSAHQLVVLVGEEEPEYALELVDRSMPLADTEAAAALAVLEAWILGGMQDATGAEEGPPGGRLREVLARRLDHQDGGAIAESLVAALERWETQGDLERAARVHGALVAEFADRPGLVSQSTSLAALELGVAGTEARVEVAGALRTLLAEHTPDWWTTVPLTGADDAASLRARIAELDSSDAEIQGFIRHAFELVTRFPPGDDFSRRLWQMAWAFDHYYPDWPGCDALIDLLDRLPLSDPQRWEAAGLRAERLRATDPEGALEVYRRAYLSEDMPDQFALAYRYRHARLLEDLGRTDEAVSAYAELVPWREMFIIVHDADLRRALLLLETGRVEEALEVAASFPRIDPEHLAQTDSPDQIVSLGALASDPRAAAELIASHDAWWPDWRNLVAAFGTWQPPETPGAPEVGDLNAFVGAMNSQLANGDSAGFLENLDLLARAARSTPTYLVNAAYLATNLGGFRADIHSASQRLAVAMLQTVPGPQSPFYDQDLDLRRHLLVAGFSFDLQRWEETGAAIDAFLAEAEPDNLYMPRIRLMQALLASEPAAERSDQREVAAEQLAAHLGPRWVDGSRGLAVLALAQLYRQLDRGPEEEALLTAEVEHPAIVGTAYASALSDRLDELHGVGDAGTFDAAYQRWWQELRQRFGWLDFAEPRSLEELEGPEWGRRTPSEWLADVDDRPITERLKVALLAVSDTDRPLEDRQEIFSGVLTRLEHIHWLKPTGLDALAAVVHDEGFGPALRSKAQFWRAWDAASGLPEALDAMREEESWQLLDEKQVELVNEMESATRRRRAGVDSAAAHVEELATKELSGLQVGHLLAAFSYVVMSRDYARAEALLGTLEGLRTEDGGSKQGEVLVFEMQRGLRAARLDEPVLAAAEDILLDGVDRSRLRQADDWFTTNGIDVAVSTLPRIQALQHLLWPLANGQFPTEEAVALPGYLADLSDGSDAMARQWLDLVLALTDAASSDEQRAGLLFAIMAGMAQEEPLWPELLQALEPWRAASDSPKTRAAMVALDTYRRRRAGEEVSWSDLKTRVDGPAGMMIHVMHVEALIQKRDREGIRKLLGDMSSDALLDDFHAGLHLHAARVGEMEEEAFLRSQVEEQVYRRILATWHRPLRWQILFTLDLADRLQDPNVVPAAWIEFCQTAIADPVFQAEVRLRYAKLRQDWPTVATAAAELAAGRRPDADLAWDQAQAAHHLGESVAALRHVRHFLEHARDHVEYQQAKALLAELETGP